MIIYLIKSSISLIVFYVFFHLYLRNYKVLLFNRYYLISSLAFSLLIPFINLPVRSIYTLSNSLNKIPFIHEPSLQNEQILNNASIQQSFPNILLVLSISVSLVLVIRFSLNIVKIIKKISNSEKIKYPSFTLVLVNERILPYSLFSFILLNKEDFEDGKIENELIKHEETHCLQYHSIDIILLELINIVLWFNPLIWLFKRAIRLNHEYYADNSVLMQTKSTTYCTLLINLVIQNNTNLLVSNFEYSLIKSRLMMMTNNRPSHYMILKKISAIVLIFIIGILVSFSQDTIKPKNINTENPKKPQIEDAATATILKDKIMILQGNVKIKIPSDSTYIIIKSDSILFDKEKNFYSVHFGSLEKFSSVDNKLLEKTFFQDLTYYLESGRTTIKKIDSMILFEDNK